MDKLINKVESLNLSKPRQYKNPVEEVKNRRLLIQRLLIKELNCFITSNTKIASSDSHSCKTPFEELKPIKLSEMKVPMIHLGRFLICRVIGEPVAALGINTLVQDLNGDVEEVVLYNFRYRLDKDEWLPPATILIIKEPSYQFESESKTQTILVHSPTDVIFVDSTDDKYLDKVGASQWYVSQPKESEFWRKEGNYSFKKERFEEALKYYDAGIRYNSDCPLLYLNKSLTCLKIGAFSAAFEAAKIGLEKGGDREKALFRMGQAKYGMREWENAAKHFLEVLKEFPTNSFASEQLKRSTTRLNEERNGKFDFKAMFIESRKTTAELDVSDFTGPIEKANIPGKGRGIIASKDIQQGTLLAVSKAFSAGYALDFPLNLFSLVPKNTDTPSHILQVINTIQKMKNNPKMAKDIYNLYSGDSDVNYEVPFGVIDAARIQKICELNRFGSDAIAEEGDVPFNESHFYSTCHLFILPSYFNHCCLANTRTTNYGDVMVIHANRDIKKGEEICLSYVNPLLDYPERSLKFSTWKFACDCELCVLDSKDCLCSKRDKMFNEFNKYANLNINSPKKIIAKGEQMLIKIRETYNHRNMYQAKLIHMLLSLAQIYYSIEDLIKSIKFYEEALTLIERNPKIKCAFNIPHIEYSLGLTYLNVGNFAAGHEMTQKAFESSFCSDFEHFKMFHRVEMAPQN